MAAVTTDNYLAVIEKSNLLSAEQLIEARQEAGEAGADADVKTVAKRLVKRGLLTRWQAEQLLAGRTTMFLGKYKLLERIGKGGMGAVYKAEHTVMGRTVALKVMAQALLNNTTAVARFHREVQAAAALNHPNIVSAYDADCVDKTHFLVMEYVRGRELKNWLDERGPLPIAWTCECIRQTALGLQHAHEHGMVHRDIKPSNLLVTSDSPDGPPVVKILDMGLARFVSSTKEDGGLTQSGQLMGTPDYIAPEQAEDTKRADIRADIFSLGCTLYQLLTGQLPYPGETIMAKLMARVNSTPSPIRSLRADIPTGLESAITKMLATDPSDRQQTPAEVAAELEPFAGGLTDGVEETIAISSPVPVQTVTSDTPQSDADSGLNDFLDRLASSPNDDTRRRGRTIRRRAATEERQQSQDAQQESDGQDEAATAEEGTPTNRSRVPVLLVSLVSFLALAALVPIVWRNRNAADPVAENAVVEPVSETVELPTFGTPDDPSQPKAGPAPTTPPKPAGTPPSQAQSKGEATAKGEAEKESESPTAKTTDAAPATSKPVDPAPDNKAEVAAATPRPHEPRTLVVGTAAGQLPDLKTAFEQAGPGDTILIQHRGPLEFDPVELSGKTPLTIAGDSDDSSIDFWPILRQSPLDPKNNEQVTTAAGLFHADQLDLKLSRLHLAAGGPQRARIDSVFSFSSGRVELDQCSVTVGVESKLGEREGQPIRFAQITPSDKVPEASEGNASLADALAARSNDAGGAEVILNATFLRGSRLKSCVDADSDQTVKLTATHTIWAGGPTPWLAVNDHGGGMQVAISNCTIYNVPSLLQWKSYDGDAGNQAVGFQVQKSLFVGPYANKEPFIVWNEGEPGAGLDRAAADGMVKWQGAENVFHHYASYFLAGGARKPPEVSDWRTLWKQSGPRMAQEADPMFRVWPEGYVLQESDTRDFQTRFWRRKRRAQQPSSSAAGADHEKLPYTLASIFDRVVPDPQKAAMPRGRTRILRVHQKNGPYKTIEAALAEVRDDDVIEIADNGPYAPRRNFSTHPAPTVLFAPTVVSCAIRAADDANPVVVLDESVQQGSVPTSNPRERTLLLLSLPRCRILQLEGIHFRFHTSSETRRAVMFATEPTSFRCSNCTFTDRTPGHGAQTNGGGSDFYAHGVLINGTSPSIWLENNVYGGARQETSAIDLKSNRPSFVHVKNCLSQGVFCRAWNAPCRVRAQSNTFLGPVMTVLQSAQAAFPSCLDNLVLVPPGVSMQDVVPLPTPPLRTAPRFEGASNAKDPYRSYRLRKGQAAATMAADGGPLGVRIEYLPDPPPAR